MIKFKATKKDGSSVIGLGITKGNVKRLKRGDPIHIDMTEMGHPGIELMVFYGDTETQIHRDFVTMGFIGPETEVKVDPKARLDS